MLHQGWTKNSTCDTMPAQHVGIFQTGLPHYTGGSALVFISEKVVLCRLQSPLQTISWNVDEQPQSSAPSARDSE
jgi:hypothetical protein